ncbi:FERRY endosomal RAB5 effector complex subunit 3 isoform X2 [Centruroides vittatus]|uniref:FERRY endosomal RAB5 effector complex subunit 3 isoform X2 n=1 Tax=Centruroides vittatus TaxID=120091 RepID=UPI00350F78C0
MAESVSKQFLFRYRVAGEEKCHLMEVPVPLSASPAEFGHRQLEEYGLPFYVQEDLFNQLEDFVLKETDHYFSKLAKDVIENFQTEERDISQIIKKWSFAFKEEHAQYAKQEELSEDAIFASMYHSLIHSPALETMLNLEHSYSLQIGELIQERDTALLKLQKRQSEEMENAVQKVGIVYTDRDINELATQHFEENQNFGENWERRIGSLKSTQRKEFHEWVLKVYEDYRDGCGSPGYQQRIRALSENIPNRDDNWIPQAQRMEESFTIHLGSQLKVMHNLRLLSTDVLDLCRHKLNKIHGIVVPQPQRLQTAISLYSNNLCGLVLLVDNRINSYTGIKRECQLESIRDNSKQASEWRMVNGPQVESGSSGKSSISSEHQNSSSLLKYGDFYITHHSNLSEVHVVFHLVTDDSLRQAEINSRHPVILGLRNILRVAHERDICTITIPLLLVHEMSEEMTIQWCLKRAELVFKCVKGFMIEMASLVGEETRTVQFLVPKGISEGLFSSLSSMLPSIFRVSNPLVLKTR